MQNTELQSNPPLNAKEAASFRRTNSRTTVRSARCGLYAVASSRRRHQLINAKYWT